MFDFHQPTMNDFDWLKRVLDQAQPMCCEYALSNLIGWSSHYGAKIACIEDCLVAKIVKNEVFGFPKGVNWKCALKALKTEYEYPSFDKSRWEYRIGWRLSGCRTEPPWRIPA